MVKYYLIFAFIVVTLFNCETKPIDKNAEFWKWFVANKTRLYEQKGRREILFEELTNQLHKVDSNLTFSFSPIHSDSVKEFTISADGIKEYFPIVRALANTAPQLDRWKINAFRQRIPSDSMSINYDDTIKISYDDIYFRYAYDSGKLALELNIRNLIDAPNFKNAVYILLDGLIGEYDVETQISSIDFILLNKGKIDDLSPLIELRKVVDKNKRLHSD